MNHAIIIAVEKYADNRIPSFDFAAADANAFSAVLSQHDFQPRDELLLLNTRATKTTIESRLRTCIRSLKSEDALFLFYSGRGFSRNSVKYLTCSDSQVDDIEETSIRLEWLFDLLQKSPCQGITLFLDACDEGISNPLEAGHDSSVLQSVELETIIPADVHFALFASCKANEKSWRNSSLGHGFWAHHLIEAFNGDAPLALENNQFITLQSLQNHLTLATRKSLRAAFTDNKVQTPISFGPKGNEMRLADVGPHLARRKVNTNPAGQDAKRVSFVRRQKSPLKKAAGFKKGFRIPDATERGASSFVAGISMEELQTDLNEVFKKLRTAFRFKREEIQIDPPVDGGGRIITPFFTYFVSVSFNPEDASEVIWQREVSEIKASDRVFSEAFGEVFGDVFDTVLLSTGGTTEVSQLIDRIELLDDADFTVDYDASLAWCLLKFKGFSGQIRMTKDAIQIEKRSPEPPRKLLEDLFRIRQECTEKCGVQSITFDPD